MVEGLLRPAERSCSERDIEQAHELWISAISLWEVATLLRLERIELDRPLDRWVADLLAGSVGCVAVDGRVATTAGTLEEFHGDPADRIIYATAYQQRMTLVTKDRRPPEHAGAHDAVRILW